MKTKIEVWGGYHDIMTPITLSVDINAVPQHADTANWLTEPGVLSAGQLRRLRRHLCPSYGACDCGLYHGTKWQEK